MQHWTVPLVDPDPAPEQITVSDSGEISYQGNVTRTRHQQADVDPIASGVPQRLEQPGWRDKVGVGDPEPLHAADGKELDDPVRSLAARLAADDPHLGISLGRDDPRHLVRRHLSPGELPQADKRLVQYGGSRSANVYRRVSPGLSARRPLPGPLTADAQPTEDCARTVGQDQLAMIAGDVGDHVHELGAMEWAYLPPRRTQVAPEPA